jgi:hypothetical protein
MKTICLTFDYELFFGKSGTSKNSIFRPTVDLIKTLDTFGIRATFFIDILYYQRLLEVNIEEANLLKEQLQLLVAKGHRIELHLHPHWLDAEYENSKWIFPNYNHYRLQSLPEEKVTDLIISGCEMLNEIAEVVVKNYTVKAFRAGGWCITPFDKLKQGFLKSGIKIDSSVAYGMKITSPPFNLDFTNTLDSECYKFYDDPTKKDTNGIFYEIPIATYRRNALDKIFSHNFEFHFLKSNNLSSEIYGDGSPIPMEKETYLKNIYSKFKTNYGFLSIENTLPNKLLNTIHKSSKNLLVIMSHPKNISQNSLECIKTLYNQNHYFLTLNDLMIGNRIEEFQYTGK